MVKNLRKLRLMKGISQQQLANIIGTSQQSINQYENHATEPDIYTLTQLADFFGTTTDFLIGYTPLSASQSPAEEPNLNKDEILLIRNFRRLSKREQESILMVMENYLSSHTQ